MTEDVFIRTIRNRFFLRGIRRVVQLPSSQSWKPPKGYSFDVDTAENYKNVPLKRHFTNIPEGTLWGLSKRNQKDTIVRKERSFFKCCLLPGTGQEVF